MEIEAFQEIHRRWRTLGYPFNSLVPSYTTAIGSSSDRPTALAGLMGVILNDGAKLPPVSLKRLEFASGTPYQTVLHRARPVPERIFPPEVAQVVRKALVNVVREGTARRLGGTRADGSPLVIGGKTGTGDNRYEVFAPNGKVLESRVINRTAIYAFFMGRRFFGVMTVYIPGEAGARYRFTSALPVQIVKALEPALHPLSIGTGYSEPSWVEATRRFGVEHPPPRAPMRRRLSRPPPLAHDRGNRSGDSGPDMPEKSHARNIDAPL